MKNCELCNIIVHSAVENETPNHAEAMQHKVRYIELGQ